MWRLIVSNCVVLLRSRRLWAGAGFEVFYIGINLLIGRFAWDRGSAIDQSLLEYMSVGALLVPVVCALTLNTDYQEGTIRNKFIAGHKRPVIYLSNLAVSWLTCLFYSALHISLALGGGLLLGGHIAEEPGRLLLRLLTGLAVLFAIASLAVGLATLMTHRSVLVVMIFLIAALLNGATILENLLAEPETVSAFQDMKLEMELEKDSQGNDMLRYYDEEGRPIDPARLVEKRSNPRYIREPLRGLLQAVNDLLPGGQLLQVMGAGEVRLPLEIVAALALGFSAAATGAGLLAFRRKDLK